MSPVKVAFTTGCYAPQAILPGGVVLTLFPPDSPYLKPDLVREPEEYRMGAPGRIASIVHIHNPSIEFHPGSKTLNTGAAIILGITMAHYWVDQNIWRFTNKERRQWLPFGLKPAGLFGRTTAEPPAYRRGRQAKHDQAKQQPTYWRIETML
jgi:hypothetical protein